MYICVVPLLLWPTTGWMTPVVAGVIAFMLLGIENVTVQIEEPMRVLCLEALCRCVWGRRSEEKRSAWRGCAGACGGRLVGGVAHLTSLCPIAPLLVASPPPPCCRSSDSPTTHPPSITWCVQCPRVSGQGPRVLGWTLGLCYAGGLRHQRRRQCCYHRRSGLRQVVLGRGLGIDQIVSNAACICRGDRPCLCRRPTHPCGVQPVTFNPEPQTILVADVFCVAVTGWT